MFKNVASQKAIFFAYDSTTNAPKTGDAANITPYVSKDYGAVTAITDTSATEMDATNAKGYYLVDLTQTETNADVLLLSAKSSTANVVVIGAPATVFTLPANFTAASIDSNGRLDIIKVAGTTQTAGDIIGDTNDIQSRLPAALTAGGNMKADALAISGDTTAADNCESYFDGTGYSDVDNLSIIRSGTAQAGAAGTITLDAGANATDDFYNNTYIQITSGTGAGQARFISDYTGATKVANVNSNWITTPDNTSVFIIWPFGSIPGASAPTAADIWTYATRVLTANTNLNDLSAAGVRSAVGLASANLDTQLSTIDDFLDTEVAAIKAKTDQLTFTTANRVDSQVFGMQANVMTAAAAAADLTTELQSGLSTLDAAGVRTAVGLASANLDTQIGTLATAAALNTVDDFLDTEIAAIKAKTDSLTFTVAGQVDANVQRINDVTITGNGQVGTEFNV